jgi:hypothetical protein
MQTAFPSARLLSAEHDEFFKWIPEDHYNAATDPDDATLLALVKVDDTLLDAYRADTGTAAPPSYGWHALHWDDAGVVHVFAYGDDEKTAMDEVMPLITESLYGEDPGDYAGYTLTVIRTYKPSSVVATAEATIEVTNAPAPASAVIDAGLAALNESRSSLWGYGIRGHASDAVLDNGTYLVYANRD